MALRSGSDVVVRRWCASAVGSSRRRARGADRCLLGMNASFTAARVAGGMWRDEWTQIAGARIPSRLQEYDAAIRKRSGVAGRDEEQPLHSSLLPFAGSAFVGDLGAADASGFRRAASVRRSERTLDTRLSFSSTRGTAGSPVAGGPLIDRSGRRREHGRRSTARSRTPTTRRSERRFFYEQEIAVPARVSRSSFERGRRAGRPP